MWEERFGELRYSELGGEALTRLWKVAGIGPDAVDHLVVTGTHGRACRAVAQRSGVAAASLGGRPGLGRGEHGRGPPLPLAGRGYSNGRSRIRPSCCLVFGDGAEALVLRTTAAVASERPTSATVEEQLGNGGPVSYGRYLAWRGILPVEPPRRPEPARTSSSAAGRSVPWKFGFEASRSEDGTVHLPPGPTRPSTWPWRRPEAR